MKDVNWGDVERLFHEAVSLSPDDRQLLLADVDAEVRSMVEDLLRHAGSDDKIARTISGAAALASRTSGMAGPYRLVEEIGHGGMGAVYLGLRADDVFEKKVAIKFVRRGMDSPELRRRFEEERRILARLEHPNIARLIDGGANPEGQPYLVMEFVQGKPITEYARDAKLDLRGRVALFLETCDAVQYAHSNLVVHRDLKPSNIAVDETGRPRLLDFGIAKLLDEGGDQRRTTTMRLLTPDYASPEQCRGEIVSTASDIYSLGAVLYELLTGERPARAETGDPAARPSSRNTEWKRLLAGDLDNIVLKAMRADAGERYITVAEFRDDLRRYLDGRPVSARDYRPWERAAKFVRRHRTASLAVAAAVASLAAGLALARNSAARAERERAMAAVERTRAEAATRHAETQTERAAQQETAAATARSVAETRFDDELNAMQHTLDDMAATHALPGAAPARRAGLEKALASLDGMVRELPANQRALYLRAYAVYQLGHVRAHDLVGPENLEGGVTLLKRAQKELEALLPAQGPPPENVVATLVDTTRDIGYVIPDVSRDPAASDPYFAEAEQLSRQAVKRHPGDPKSARMLARVLSTKYRTSIQRRPGKDTPEEIAACLKTVEALLGGAPQGLEDINLLANLVGAQASAYRVKGLQAEELERYRAQMVLREKALELAPMNTDVLMNLNVTYGNVLSVERLIDPTSAESEQVAQRMVAVAERLAADPKDRLGQWQLAAALVRLGSTKFARNDLPGALQSEQRGVDLMKKLATADEKSTSWHVGLATYTYELGNILQRLNRAEEAAGSWRDCLTAAEALVARGDTQPITLHYAAKCSVKLGGSSGNRGAGEASQLVERGIGYQEKATAASSDPVYQFFLGQTLGDAAVAYSKLGQAERARNLAGRALEIVSHLGAAEQARWAPEDRDSVRLLAGLDR